MYLCACNFWSTMRKARGGSYAAWWPRNYAPPFPFLWLLVRFQFYFLVLFYFIYLFIFVFGQHGGRKKGRGENYLADWPHYYAPPFLLFGL